MREFTNKIIHDEVAETGAGTSVKVKDFRHVIIAIATSGSANMTFKVQGSVDIVEPDFDSAQAVANLWDYVQVTDLEDGSTIDGDDGIALAGSDDVRLFEVNTNGLEFINVNVTAYVAGKLTAIVRGYN